METKANHVIIGLFILLSGAFGLGFIFWMQNYGQSAKMRYFNILFDGPVTGLSPASRVLFNGVKAGKVIDFAIDPADPRRTLVMVGVNREFPVRTDSFARISTQGLSAYAAVMITPGTPTGELIAWKPAHGEISADRRLYPVIKAAPGGNQSLFQAAPEVLNNANSLLLRLNELVAANESNIRDSVKNVKDFTETMARSRGRIETLVDDAGQMTARLSAAAVRLDRMVERNETNIDEALGSVKRVTATLDNSRQDISEAIANAKKLTGQLDDLLGKNAENITKTVQNAAALSDTLAQNRGRVEKILAQTEEASASLNGAAKRFDGLLADNEKNVTDSILNIATFTKALSDGGDDVKVTFANARELSERLKSVAGKMETALDDVSGMLNPENGEALIVVVREAADSFRSLATKLDKSIGGASDGIARFAKTGLQEFERLMTEGRRMVRTMDRILDKFDKNPQGLIFGGKSVREYKSN